jgi:lysyl-tRNA synthetase class 2
VTEETNFVLQARREKLEALEAAGVAAYGYGFDRRHSASDAQSLLGNAEQGPEVSLAGRVVAWRSHGKTTFAHLADSTGKIQLYFKKDQLGDEAYSLLAHFDLGDIIGVHGPLFRTRTGEVTVRVDKVEMLAKSLRPLPFGKEEEVNGQIVRHSGFADAEQRYRQRYADLAVQPEVRALFIALSKMTRAIRQ